MVLEPLFFADITLEYASNISQYINQILNQKTEHFLNLFLLYFNKISEICKI